VILTKSDASSAEEQKHALASSFGQIMAKRMSSCMPFVHLVSSKSGDGVTQLQRAIVEILEHNWAKLPSDEISAGRVEEAEYDEEKEEVEEEEGAVEEREVSHRGLKTAGQDLTLLDSLVKRLPEGTLDKIKQHLVGGRGGEVEALLKELNRPHTRSTAENNYDDNKMLEEEKEEARGDISRPTEKREIGGRRKRRK